MEMNPMNPMTPAAGAAANPVGMSAEEMLAQREKEIIRRELHARALERLAQQQMPVELAELLDYADEERFEESYELVKRAFSKAVRKGVEARVADGAPKAQENGAMTAGTLTSAIADYYNVR